ncbi:OmpA family protein [Rhizobium oryzicola]|uniref:OmpA family protein n=2 Tax=Rhizobium oryzicola TaxID=1232668 RepID=A0ABT8T4I1_9HYPH|nr:OmpA family protein [Rhizobium oryzicola]MDO1585053.1 OmpA family protein [Rhizobium oryzicola]
MPILSVTLTVQSALAGVPGVMNAIERSGPSVLVVPVQAPAPDPQEEELLKRKRQQEEQRKGAPEGQPHGQRPEGQPRPEGQRPEGQRPEGQRPEAPRPPAEPPRAEPKAEPRPEPKAEPRPEPKAEPRPAPQEPAPRPPTPEPKKTEPSPPPPAPKAAAPERAPEPPKPPVPPAGSERPQPPALKGEPPKPEPAKPEPPAPRAAAPAEPAQKPREAAPAEKVAPPPPPGPAAKPPAPEAAKPGEPPAPRAPEPRAGEPGAPKPPAPPAPPAGAAPPPPPPEAGEPPRLPPANGAPGNGAQRPPVPGPEGQRPVPPPPGAPRPPAPADQTGRPVPPPPPGAPQPATAAAPQTPQTPQDIERAKRIANNPAAAPANQPVVLPVQNGAPVLDSAKDAAVAPPPPPPGAPAPAGQRPGLPPPPPGAPAPQPGQAPLAAQPPMAPPGPPPRTDADAQAFRGAQQAPIRIEPAISERGRRMDRAPEFALPPGFEDRAREQDGRVIIQYNNQVFVRHDDDRRFYDEGYRPQYESLPGDRVREIIERDDGVRIVTIRNRYGDIIQRSRVDRRGDEVVLYYAPELQAERGRDYQWRDPGLDLPPMRLAVPVSEYIIDTTSDPDRDYYRFLEQPPVERVERVYSIDEVRYSARIRDKMRRIDLDTITFATGSADIPMNQASTLRKVANAIQEVLQKNPAETFLIEGHTDAVGSDESNLILSDRRAESVARVLTEVYGIPAENMVTQGYGERYLKVRTDGPNQENRRVTIRRITPLVRPVASNQ